MSPLQAKLRNMEKQVEWVRAERDELAANAATEARELGARVKEGEAALTRLKALDYSPLFTPAVLCSKLPWGLALNDEGEAALTRLKARTTPHSACAAQPAALKHATASFTTSCSTQLGSCQLPDGQRQRQLTGLLADGVW